MHPPWTHAAVRNNDMSDRAGCVYSPMDEEDRLQGARSSQAVKILLVVQVVEGGLVPLHHHLRLHLPGSVGETLTLEGLSTFGVGNGVVPEWH